MQFELVAVAEEKSSNWGRGRSSSLRYALAMPPAAMKALLALSVKHALRKQFTLLRDEKVKLPPCIKHAGCKTHAVVFAFTRWPKLLESNVQLLDFCEAILAFA